MAATTIAARLLVVPRPPRAVVLALAGAALVVGYVALRGQYPYPSTLVSGVEGWLDRVNDWAVSNRNTHPVFIYGLNHVSNAITLMVGAVYRALVWLTVPGLVTVSAAIAWLVAGWRVGLGVVGAYAVFGVLGLWDESLRTLALMTVCVLLSLAIGIPAGVFAGRSARVQQALSPVLDTMQVLPAFAYLLPVVLLFGVSVPAAAVATIVYAVPPAVRLTALGVRGVPAETVEAATSLGSTSRQLLTKVQLPGARSQIMLGVNQTIMMALSMVVIASVVGASGLGDPVLAALNSIDVGQAANAGLAIVVMAVALDRVTARDHARAGTSRARRGWRRALSPAVACAAAVGGVVAGYAYGLTSFPSALSASVAAPVATAAEWVQQTFSAPASATSAALVSGLLEPLNSLLAGSPWWLVLGVVVVVGACIGGLRGAADAAVALFLVGVLGDWKPALNTLSQVVVAMAVTLALGLVGGVLVANSRRLESLTRPLLDAMQTLPQMVYLVPVVVLFAVGRTPGIIASVVYALPVVVRIIANGLREVPAEAVEAATMAGSSRWQLLTKVQLPLARPALMLAVNQAIVMVLAVVVIGALTGSGALGFDVIYGFAQNELGVGLTAGISIVCLGIMLDRITGGSRATERRWNAT